jgi:hypothetical protein
MEQEIMGVFTVVRNRLNFFWLLLFLSSILMGQRQNQNPGLTFSQQDYPRSGERYVTDQHGVIRMWVNIWGHVERPGSYLVYDGIDLPALLSVTGGPKTGANLKKIKLFRDEPDAQGNLSYTINMRKFLTSGNKVNFVNVLPNDTYVVEQTVTNYVLSNVSIVNSIEKLNLDHIDSLSVLMS